MCWWSLPCCWATCTTASTSSGPTPSPSPCSCCARGSPEACCAASPAPDGSMVDAGVALVRPLLLDGVACCAALVGVADVPNLAVDRIVPGQRFADGLGQPDLGIGHGLDEFVRG